MPEVCQRWCWFNLYTHKNIEAIPEQATCGHSLWAWWAACFVCSQELVGLITGIGWTFRCLSIFCYNIRFSSLQSLQCLRRIVASKPEHVFGFPVTSWKSNSVNSLYVKNTIIMMNNGLSLYCAFLPGTFAETMILYTGGGKLGIYTLKTIYKLVISIFRGLASSLSSSQGHNILKLMARKTLRLHIFLLLVSIWNPHY